MGQRTNIAYGRPAGQHPPLQARDRNLDLAIASGWTEMDMGQCVGQSVHVVSA
ncbi:MAG: hypothetical protein U1E45_20745 [Geminicoccaceae bacterium]